MKKLGFLVWRVQRTVAPYTDASNEPLGGVFTAPAPREPLGVPRGFTTVLSVVVELIFVPFWPETVWGH